MEIDALPWYIRIEGMRSCRERGCLCHVPQENVADEVAVAEAADAVSTTVRSSSTLAEALNKRSQCVNRLSAC